MTLILIIGLVVCPLGIVTCFAIFAAAERADRREERLEAAQADREARRAYAEALGLPPNNLSPTTPAPAWADPAVRAVQCLPPTVTEAAKARRTGEDAERWLRHRMWEQAREAGR